VRGALQRSRQDMYEIEEAGVGACAKCASYWVVKQGAAVLLAS
jgi:hypothetical protein